MKTPRAEIFSLLLVLAMCGGAEVSAQKVSVVVPAPPGSQSTMPTVIATLHGSCKLVVGDLQGGYIEGPNQESPNAVAIYFNNFSKNWAQVVNIPLNCKSNLHPEESNLNEINIALGVTRRDGKWVPADGREQSCDPHRFGRDERSKVNRSSSCFYPEEHLKIINFKGKNWIGVGVLLDETSGKPQFKQRKFSYCLKEETSTSALCGYTHVRYLMNPKHDVLNKVLKIFSSIEFVNSASQPPAPGHSIRPR